MKIEKTEAEKKAEQQARETWDTWVEDLGDKKQPKSCDVHDETCENCGS